MQKKLRKFVTFGVLGGVLCVGMLGVVMPSLGLADAPPVPAGAVSEAPAQSGGAAAPGAAQGVPPAPGIGGMLMPFLLMFAVIYFLMIRPQQKKMKEHQTMIGGLQHGDEVITTSGILGKVSGITDKVVTIEIADDVKVKMLKSQVSQVLKGQIKELT